MYKGQNKRCIYMIVCYCRKSRVSESDELDRQVRLVKDYCKTKGYTIHKVFAEVGSSVDADRPEYTALLNLLNKHKNCTIVVTDLDRLSRHTVILGLFQQLCKEQGHLVELTNGTVYNYSDYTDSFTSDIIASVSAYIYKQTSAKLYRGLKQAQKEGKRVGAKLFGYNIVNKRLVVNPEQADIVRRVFKLIAEGISTAEVVRILKQDDIRTNTGRYFNTRAVRLMIQNEGYIGRKGDNIYPPIISRELYLEANQQLKSIPNCGNKRTYALSGKIICSHCNNIMILGYKKDRDLIIVSKGMSKTCKCSSIRLDVLEGIVLSDTCAYLENKLYSMYDQLKSNNSILSSHKQEIEAIEKEIQSNSKKLDKLKDMYIMDIIDKEELQNQSTEIKDNIARLTLKKERISNYSLYEKVTQLQDNVIEIEEFLHNPSIELAVKYIDKVLYWKSEKTTEVNVKFKG